MLVRYWLLGNPWSLSKYLKKFKISPEKLVASLTATKLNTRVLPLYPEYSLKLTLSIVTVATAEPVLEIGPAPPMAASQTMISYSLEPPDVEDVNIS